MKKLCILVAGVSLALGHTARAEQFSINDALNQAIRTNPGVGEAAANRRATESELRQTQSTLLPQVRLEGRYGPEKFRDSTIPTLINNDKWRQGNESSVVVRQLLFDGFASIHDIWRQSARVNAAAFRVRERTELIALDAAEAYVDVVRYLRLVGLADQNVRNHEKIFANVNSRYQGGRSGEGDLEQARSRVENARAQQAEFIRSLDDARSKYRRIVGLEPVNLRFPGPLPAMPRSKDEALAATLRMNPTLLAAGADADAARSAFRVTDGAFVPTVALEGRAAKYDNTYPYNGTKHEDYTGKVVVSWDIFRGGQDVWRRSEMAERYTQAALAKSRLQRDALESIDKAWAARTITADKISALARQLQADKKTIAAYQKEYELGQRSLIDLLNAENEFFNASVSLTSSRGVLVFADYQLLAAMGVLLQYLKEAPPVDAAPLDQIPVAVFPYAFPTPRVTLPNVGSEPLQTVFAPVAPTPYAYAPASRQASNDGFDARWKVAAEPAAATSGRPAWTDQGRTAAAAEPTQALGFAPIEKPMWLQAVSGGVKN
jgi:adhesin transport system outer membrane protein